MSENESAFDWESRTQAAALLRGATIAGLHGRYNYEITVPLDVMDQRLVLFYGENGSGKTTVLRLIWHILSAAESRGHRNSVAKVIFRSLDLFLSNGDHITALRPEPVPGPYQIIVQAANGTELRSEWPSTNTMFTDWPLEALADRQHGLPNELAPQAQRELQRRLFISYLEGLQVRPYFLADDRIIYSDELEDAAIRRREVVARRVLTSEGSPAASPDEAQGAVVQELETSLRRASEYLRELTLGGNASGSAGANSVYLDVLQRLGHYRADEANRSALEARDELVFKIAELGARSRAFEEFGLVPRFESRAFIEAVKHLHASDRVNAASDMLSPYLNSLSARLDALQDAESLTRTFSAETNGFLRDKSLTFALRGGLRIRLDDNGEALGVQQLSSGERQLILLLCNALLARRGTRLFLIDEPELSLNAKWQRRILEALLACTNGTSVQFLVATHSLELLASYRPSVVRFENLQN